MLSIDSAPLQAAVLAVKRADRELRRDIGQKLRESNPDWQRAVAARAVTDQDRAVTRVGTRIATGNPPTLQAMTSRRPISPDGLQPARDYYMVEFGSSGPYGQRGQLPRRRRQGRIVYPAVAQLAPLVAGRWAQAIRDAYVKRARMGVESNG